MKKSKNVNCRKKLKRLGLSLLGICCFLFTRYTLLVTDVYPAAISVQRIGSVDMNRIMEAYPEAKKMKDELSSNLKIKKDNIKIFQQNIEAAEDEVGRMEEELKKYEYAKREQEISEMAMQSSNNENTSTEQVESSTETFNISYGSVVKSTGSVAASTSTAVTSKFDEMKIEPTKIEPVQISSPSFTQNDITLKIKNIEKQKKDLENYIAGAKKDEKEINSKVKKNILGKIYDAIKETANERGLAIIIDSSNLIYGEDSEDITETVIKKLK
ncbi:MAG: hypothetical protein A2539_06115 [Elusimicrobia bacterium RIFOXYD2_FULL_34_15]|nr:MAG: hypothetical protein A2539_06115 [Elusimicrobia bacterium RIFOXYD2_FULL_34_15]